MATALITGGTSGIGAAFARELAASGDDLVLVARDSERLERVAAQLHSAWGIRVEVMSADLGVRADVDRVAARLEEPGSPIDLLVNCAGFGVNASLLSVDTAPHDRAMDVMCRAILVLSAAAGRSMLARGGTIITVSSLQSFLATGSYGAIKAWVTAHSQGLAVELRDTPVTITAVLPGWVRTEWHERAGVSRSSVPDWLWIEPETVASWALRDAARGRVISIPTIRYRMLGLFARHLPMVMIRGISARISSQRASAASDDAAGSESPAVQNGSAT